MGKRPMIVGVGVDIVKASRFEKRPCPRFMARVFTPRERDYLRGKKAPSFAGLFAAKEAVAKALGTGFRGFWPADIEIAHSQNGRPYVILHGRAREMIKSHQKTLTFSISISHTASDAIAFAVVEA